jgi:hypothetical protein
MIAENSAFEMAAHHCGVSGVGNITKAKPSLCPFWPVSVCIK